MRIFQLFVMALLITIYHQSKTFDSTMIISSKIGTPKEFISSCNNQFPSSYFQDEEDNFNQIKQHVFQTFKTDPKHFILKLIMLSHNDQKQLGQDFISGIINQFKQYLSWLRIVGIIFIGILIYWVYSIIERKILPQSAKRPLIKIQNKYLRAILLLFIILSALGGLFMIKGLYQSKYDKLISTVLCKAGSLDLFQPIKDIKDYNEQIFVHYSKMSQFLNGENVEKYTMTTNYIKQLIKIGEKSQTKDQTLLKQLRYIAKIIQDLYPIYSQFFIQRYYFQHTIQLIESRLNNLQIYKYFMIKDFNKQISIAKLPSKISFVCNLFYLFVLGIFVYVGIIGALLLFKNQTKLFKKSFLVPYFLALIIFISFSIVLLNSIVTPSVVLWNKSIQNIRKDEPQNFPNANYGSFQYSDVLQFIKILFNKNYNIQNILNGSVYRSTLNFNRALSVFQNKADDYLLNLITQMQSKVDLTQVQKINDFRHRQYQKQNLQYPKQLIINFKDCFNGTTGLLQEEFFNKPKIRIKQNKIENFNLLQGLQKAIIIQSQRARSLFKAIGFIALFTLIFQIIIQRKFIQIDQSENKILNKGIQLSAHQLTKQNVSQN